MDDIGIAADRAILDILLISPAGCIKRDNEPLAAGRADIRPFIPRPTTFALTGFHQHELELCKIAERPTGFP